MQKASQRLRAQKQKYSQYSKDCGLGTHYDRTQVYGYDRSKSAKTVWAERKAAQNGSGSAPVTPSASGGHDVAVNLPTPADNGGKGKLYRDEVLTNSGGSGIINLGYHAGFGEILNNISGKIQSKIYPERSPVSKEFLDKLPKITKTESLEDAVKNSNPKNYRNNCQRSVQALEMRRRGFNVTAQPAPSDTKFDNIGLFDFRYVFKGAKWIQCSGNGYDDIMEYMSNAEINTRIHISIKTQNWCHLFTAEKSETGVIFCDPLFGKTGDDLKKYFFYEQNGPTEFARVDNLDVTELINQCIEV